MQISNTSISQSFVVDVLNFKNPPSRSPITGFNVVLSNSGVTKSSGTNGVI